MKIRTILALTACATLIGSPITRILAEDAPAAAPTAKPATKEPAKKPEAKPIDPERQKMNEARMKASQDPDVKAALEEARKAQVDATKKLLAKMREIDPSLGPLLDKEEEKMKPREKAAPKAPKDKAAKPDAKKADEKKDGDKPADKPADQ